MAEMRRKLVIEEQGKGKPKREVWIWNSDTEGNLWLGVEAPALIRGDQVARGGALYWLEPATEKEALRVPPRVPRKSKGDALLGLGGSEKQFIEMAKLKRSEIEHKRLEIAQLELDIAEIEEGRALLRQHGKKRK
jgi:hypothetical protein